MGKEYLKPDILQYFNFRKFLADYLSCIRQRDPDFSFQHLVDNFGLKSRSHYLDILNGRKLTKRFLPIYERICEFDVKEARYFKTLVAFNQSKSVDEKKELFEKIIKLAPNLETVQLENEIYDYFQHWYIPAMISVLDIYKNESDHREIAKKFMPPITAVQARKALNVLKKLEFISWDKDKNEWIFLKKFFRCSSDSQVVALRQFHQEMHQLGEDAYMNQFDEQTFSTLTVSVSENIRKEIDVMIAELRRKVMDLAKEDKNPEVAVQVNFQTFLLSQRKNKLSKEGK
jgi:uncharacterized protein (TIGR02147 family)